MPKPAHYQELERELVGELFDGFARTAGRRLRVLDYGCGRGKYMDAFSSAGFEVTGVDANADYVAEARERGFAAYAPGDLPADSRAAFDVVFLSHLIEHLPPESLVDLIPRLCRLLRRDGRLVVITPTPGERFYHDFSHVRPYLPQSVRHAFGQTGAPISYGETRLIELVDIYFFRDPHRTRMWRSFYVGGRAPRALTRGVNAMFDLLWRISGGRIGVVASWLGVYRVLPPAGSDDASSED